MFPRIYKLGGKVALGLMLTIPGFSNSAHADSSYILTDLMLLQKQSIEPLMVHRETGTAFAAVTDRQRNTIAHEAHDHNRCGGHELITSLPPGASPGQAREFAQNVFSQLDLQLEKDRDFQVRRTSGIGINPRPASPNPAIQSSVNEVSESNLRATVDFLSKYPSRNHKSKDGKDAVIAFKAYVEKTLAGASIPFSVDLVTHSSTPMSSLRLTFPGLSKKEEVVIAGGHIDSINSSFFGGSKSAPGVDDNASGSANILEAARILAKGPQPERTIEIYWYAGEEGGLLGSSEIASAAKSSGRKIVGVLQLDMTLFPGDGEFTLGSMTDFTSLEMRELLVTINRDYIGAKILEDKCGYGCSDHASWYRNGFPTLMPFEATTKKMNKAIHTDRDVVSTSLSFRHSAMFSKIAVAFLMTLAN